VTTTAPVAESPAVVAPLGKTPARYEDLPLSKLVEAKDNPRKVFHEARMMDLVNSIRELGRVITSLIVRPKGNLYEIAAGHRRYRAAKRAGILTVPCVIFEMTDTEFREILNIENLQREDPHPLEEADGFQGLLETGKHTPESIAQRIGKDVSTVYRRLALLRLIKPLQEAFLADEIQLGHASLLCRLQESDQIRAMKEALFEERYRWDGGKRITDGKEAVPIAELRHWIESRIMLVLDNAAWDRTDATLPGGACTACPKRTGHNFALFDDLGKDDKCMDGRCYQKKQTAFLAREIEQAKRKGAPLVPVVKGWANGDAMKGALAAHSYHTAAKACKKPEAALIVAGDDIGKRITICRDAKCGARAGGSAAPPKKLTPMEELKQRESRLDEDIRDAQTRELMRRVMAKVKKIGRVEMDLIARERIDYAQLQELAAILGVKGERVTVKQLLDALKKANEEQFAKVIAGSFIADDYNGEDTTALCKAYKIDRKAVEKEVATKMRLDFKRDQDAAAKAKK